MEKPTVRPNASDPAEHPVGVGVGFGFLIALVERFLVQFDIVTLGAAFFVGGAVLAFSARGWWPDVGWLSASVGGTVLLLHPLLVNF